MKNNTYIKQIIELNETIIDRKKFHAEAGKLLIKMGQDKQFLLDVIKQNLTDKAYLNRSWTMYEIPFFYVYETDDFNIKVHLFLPLPSYMPHVAASAIHHHNNYLLSTYAAFGSGYETILFEKNIDINSNTKETKLKIRDHFTQAERPLHFVDAWEPHVVVNPTSLSATVVLWSPDKKRVTDALRSNPLLKAFKIPLRKLIYSLGMDKKIGISAKETYQFYVENNKFHAVLEDDFFAPTRAQAGLAVNDYSIQTIFAFIQRMGLNDPDFFNSLKKSKDVPIYFHQWIDMLLANTAIPDTYAKETINIPGGKMMLEDIIQANKSVNNI